MNLQAFVNPTTVKMIDSRETGCFPWYRDDDRNVRRFRFSEISKNPNYPWVKCSLLVFYQWPEVARFHSCDKSSGGRP